MFDGDKASRKDVCCANVLYMCQWVQFFMFIPPRIVGWKEIYHFWKCETISRLKCMEKKKIFNR